MKSSRFDIFVFIGCVETDAFCHKAAYFHALENACAMVNRALDIYKLKLYRPLLCPAEIKDKSVTDHQQDKTCAILQLVSAPSNPVPTADHFRRSHPLCELSY